MIKGSHHTKESIEKNRNNNLGKKPWNKGKINVYSDDTLNKMSKPKSEYHRKKISESLMGNIPWNKGIPRTQEEKNKISRGNKDKKRSNEAKLKLSKSREYRIGDKSPNWQGGISFEPYCFKFNEKLKEQIRERDNRVCQECSKTELENGKKLSVHHIHYDKENCEPDLISLCDICNSHANKNRDYWEEYFMKKLKERNLIKEKL